MSGQHVRDRAAGLASLPADDPERRAAEDHSRGCRECASALREGGLLAALLASIRPPAAPPPEALRRASAEILAQMAIPARPATRRWLPVRWSLGPAAAVLAAWAAPLAMARQRIGSSPALVESAAVALLAAVAAAVAITIGGPAMALIPAASAVFSLAAGEAGSLHASTGIKCALFEITVSLLPVLVAAVIVRYRDVRMPVHMLATTGAAGALAGHAVLHITCPVPTATPHLLVFHTGGVLLAAILGATMCRVPALRPRNRTPGP